MSDADRITVLERQVRKLEKLTADRYPDLAGMSTGAVLRATSASTAAFGAVDLADTDAVTGVLPFANIGTTGTWTPAFTGSGTAGVYTYTTAVGVYTLIGTLVYIQARIAISAIGTPPTGSMAITGLPFTCEGSFHPVSFGYISFFNNVAGAVQLIGVVVAAAAKIDLYESFDNAGAVAVQAANFTSTQVDLIFSGVYRV